jgi:hypothetical protein
MIQTAAQLKYEALKNAVHFARIGAVTHMEEEISSAERYAHALGVPLSERVSRTLDYICRITRGNYALNMQLPPGRAYKLVAKVRSYSRPRLSQFENADMLLGGLRLPPIEGSGPSWFFGRHDHNVGDVIESYEDVFPRRLTLWEQLFLSKLIPDPVHGRWGIYVEVENPFLSSKTRAEPV